MAISIDSTTNLHLIDACEATTGWTFSGITKTSTSTASREGTNCVGGQVANASYGFAYHTHGSSVNMTTAGNERVYVWVNSVGPGTFAQNGWMVVIGDGTNRRAYTVGGSDVVPFSVKGWYCLMLDTANLPTPYSGFGSGTPTLTAITEFGFGIYNVVAPSGNALNVFVDVVRYGSGIIVTSGASDEISLADVAAEDFSSAAGKAYGIIREIQPGVYGIQGDILWGDTAGNSIDYKETDAVVVFEDHVLGSGTNTKFQFSGQHSATGTFSAELGIAVSSGDAESGRNGVVFVNANPDDQPVDFDFSDSDIEDVFLYGCSLTGMKGTIKFSNDATNGVSHHLSGVSFSNCSQIDTGRTVVRNSRFIGYTSDTDASLLWSANIDIKNCQFLGSTDGTNDPHAIEHPASGSFTYDNLTFSGNDYDVNFSAASGTLTITNSNGSNATTYEITGSGTSVTFINNPVDLTVHCQTKTGTDISGVRVRMVCGVTGPWPYQEAVTLSHSAGTVTATHTGHGLTTGDKVEIRGTTDAKHKGIFQITVTGANAYTYSNSRSPQASDSGTATLVIIDGTTDVDGDISATRAYSSAQDYSGWARKSTSSPYYQEAPTSGVIYQSNVPVTLVLTSDE